MRIIITAAIFFAVLAVSAHAGVPFITDDPAPIDYRCWEIIAGSQLLKTGSLFLETAPHIEANYGAFHNIELHLLVPMLINSTTRSYGLSDIESGIKARVIKEGNTVPEISSSIAVLFPTGNHSRGLGTGQIFLLLPLWLQKTFDPFSAYGGGGYWLSIGPSAKSFWLFGTVIQGDWGEKISLGAEVYLYAFKQSGAPTDVAFNVGGSYAFTETHQLLLSIGTGIAGEIDLSAYAGFRVLIGTPER
jgi:hypothetical protein